MPKSFTEAEREEFLAGDHIAVVSVAADDGRPPMAFPIWYEYTSGGDFLINTGAATRKARLIEQSGAVTLTIQRGTLPYQYVIVEGTVTEAVTPSPFEAREGIAVRYLGPESGRAFAENADGDQAVLFTIRPDRWSTKDYSGEV
ncbi:pyridoxamine 5'-phosphate oxidase family protein [Sciscionella marina]|uniref:pyridoxamine 5'-phosphate oxidase family protein n=1 Tax=Sciscionella marina TaxID=508770 RepID=UPI00036B47DF|nr:pyridoxamine 5'-phosphate oxidase family protein [Sciscionella marina]